MVALETKVKGLFSLQNFHRPLLFELDELLNFKRKVPKSKKPFEMAQRHAGKGRHSKVSAEKTAF